LIQDSKHCRLPIADCRFDLRFKFQKERYDSGFKTMISANKKQNISEQQSEADRNAVGKSKIENNKSKITNRQSAIGNRQLNKSVTIVCDGSSLGNGQGATKASAVALLGYKGFWRAVGKFLGNTTNQQAEIAAATLGLKALREPCNVRLLTDSRYVVETMNGRFRRKTNHDWWDELDRAAKIHKITWEWTEGHAGHIVQEAVDKAARKIATIGRVDEKVLRDAVDKVGTIEL
jgi:ribonuclease HI